MVLYVIYIMSTKNYKIGSLSFKTKKALENHVRSFISNIGCGSIIPGTANYKFIHDVLNNHPNMEEKVGDGISKFEIQLNPINKKGYEILIHRLDGSITNFSWVICCTFLERSNSQILTRVMRYTIRDQIVNFRAGQIKKCNICQINSKHTEYHVDHIHPFSIIKNEFLNQTKHPIPTTFIDDEFYMPIFNDVDKEFMLDWKRYHEERSNFQILCAPCNLSKSDKII